MHPTDTHLSRLAIGSRRRTASGSTTGRTTRPLASVLPVLALLLLAPTVPALAATGVQAARWLNPSPQGNSIEALAFESDLVGYGVGVRGTTLRTTDGGVTWNDLSRPLLFSADLHDLETLGPGQLLAVGSGAGIYVSDDAGESWRVVANPSTGTLRHLGRIGGTTYSAVGDDGQRLVSSDGGASWSLGPNTGLLFSHSQAWLTPNHGWVVGSPNVMETLDGGQTWTQVELEGFSFEFFDIQFADASNGWLSEVFSMYRTTDGGATWMPMPQTPLYLNTQIIYSNTHRILICAGEGAEIYETRDDGGTWSPLYQRFATVSYTDIVTLPSGRVVVASSDGDLLYSDDEGASWTNSTDGPGDEDRIELWQVWRRPDGRGFATGADGDWLRTSDDGVTWTREASPLGAFSYDVEVDANGLGFGAGVGDGTTLARTTDGGDTWTHHQVHPSFVGSPAGFEFPSADVVWAAFQGTNTADRVFRSTDAGLTWESRSNGIASNADPIESISFVSPDHGYVAGGWLSAQSKLLRTTNGGLDWEPVPFPSTIFRIWDMYWPSFDHGFLAARDTVYETTDGGATWTTNLETDVYEMSWRDPQRGAAYFYLSPAFQVTVDGGSSWIDVEVPWSTGILDIEWVSDSRLWIAGPGSRLLEVDLYEPADVPETGPEPSEWGGERVRLLRNPVRNELALELASSAPGAARFEWFDATGRSLGVAMSEVGDGRSAAQISVPRSTRGTVLFLRVELPDGSRSSHQVVVLK
ncbi:MAG: YCF48-related protein [Candidatus Eisenbacteria bacterium]